MGVYLGFDPGGAGAFGWCLAEGNALPLHVIETGVGDHAQNALDGALAVAGKRTINGVGIDAPLFWRRDGDRQVDQLVRTQIVELGSPGGTVNSVNSMRGACLVQGVAIGMLLRQTLGPDTPISESHPKAALWLLQVATRRKPPAAISLTQMPVYFTGNIQHKSDHERDAAMGALSAFAMTTNLQGWQDLFQHEVNPLLPIPAVGYWMLM